MQDTDLIHVAEFSQDAMDMVDKLAQPAPSHQGGGLPTTTVYYYKHRVDAQVLELLNSNLKDRK